VRVSSVVRALHVCLLPGTLACLRTIDRRVCVCLRLRGGREFWPFSPDAGVKRGMERQGCPLIAHECSWYLSMFSCLTARGWGLLTHTQSSLDVI